MTTHADIERLNDELEEARALAVEWLYSPPQPEDWGHLRRVYPWLISYAEWIRQNLEREAKETLRRMERK